MASANPALNVAVYERAGRSETSGSVMTLGGSVVKSGILLLILTGIGAYVYGLVTTEAIGNPYGLMVGGALGGLVIAFVTIFFPRVSPITAPIYAALEGVFLGTISAAFEARYHGIAMQAVMLSVGVAAVMLFVYGTGMIQVTARFRTGVVAATGAIFLVYLASWIMRLFGVQVPFIHDAGPIGIGFSLVVVVIAALNLILDFDFIEQGVKHEAPKYMEWYGAFSLVVTLVWMYLEILRLLAKLRGNRN